MATGAYLYVTETGDVVTVELTKHREKNRSEEADSSSASLEIIRILWKPSGDYHSGAADVTLCGSRRFGGWGLSGRHFIPSKRRKTLTRQHSHTRRFMTVITTARPPPVLILSHTNPVQTPPPFPRPPATSSTAVADQFPDGSSECFLFNNTHS